MRKYWDTIIVAILAAAAIFLWVEGHDLAADRGMLFLAGLFAGFFSIIMLPLVIWRFKRVKLGIYLAFLLATVLLSIIPTTSRDFFVRRLHSLQPGMTISEVNQVMAPYNNRRHDTKVIGDEGWLPKDFKTADREISFRHSDSGNYNADIGQVYFRNGKVLGTRYLPD